MQFVLESSWFSSSGNKFVWQPALHWNNPKSIAVGVIYLLSQNYNLGFTKKEIADLCKTSEVTVSNTYTQMNKFKKYLLPKE